jgi:DNA-binding response OmpR family regulator
MKILIIEDEKELVLAIKNFLETEGFLCETACSYFEAEDSLSVSLQKMLHMKFKLLLLPFSQSLRH